MLSRTQTLLRALLLTLTGRVDVDDIFINFIVIEFMCSLVICIEIAKLFFIFLS